MSKKLIFSLLCNFVLLAAFLHHKTEKTKLISLVEVESVETAFQKIKKSGFVTVSQLLLDSTHVESGIRICDLALGYLIREFDFDGISEIKGDLKKSNIIVDQSTCPLYLGLSKEQFQALHQYARRCKYPFTLQGFLKRLHTKQGNQKEFLAAFFFKPEVAAIKYLFPNISAEVFVELIKEVDLEFIQRAYCTIQKYTDVNQLRQSLLYYALFDQKSSFAAYFLAMQEPEFVLKSFSDDQLLVLLKMFHTKSANLPFFLYKLSLSNRSMEVCQSAYYLYCNMIGIPFDANHLEQVQSHYLSHFVANNETLEDIASYYQIDITVLKSVNKIEGKIPKILFIPKDQNRLLKKDGSATGALGR